MLKSPVFVLLAATLAGAALARDFRPIGLTPASKRSRALTGPRVTLRRPTKDFPCRWKLPSTWNGFRRKLDHGGLVAYFSGSDTSMTARVYSWPIEDVADGPLMAQSKLLSSFSEPVLLDITVPRGDEIFLTLWGSSEGDVSEMNFQEERPDLAYLGRVGRVGDRLVAAVVGVRKPENPADQPLINARELLEKLEWKKANAYASAYGTWGY